MIPLLDFVAAPAIIVSIVLGFPRHSECVRPSSSDIVTQIFVVECYRTFSVLARAAITKYRTLGGLNNRNCFSHSSGAGSLGWGCQHGWVLMRVAYRWLPSRCVSTWQRERDTEHILWGFFLEGHQPHQWSPIFMTSCEPNYLLKAPSPDTIMLGGRASTYKFWGNTVQSTEFNSSVLVLNDW